MFVTSVICQAINDFFKKMSSNDDPIDLYSDDPLCEDRGREEEEEKEEEQEEDMDNNNSEHEDVVAEEAVCLCDNCPTDPLPGHITRKCCSKFRGIKSKLENAGKI